MIWRFIINPNKALEVLLFRLRREIFRREKCNSKKNQNNLRHLPWSENNFSFNDSFLFMQNSCKSFYSCFCQFIDKKNKNNSKSKSEINIIIVSFKKMFQNTYQSGFLSILYSIGSKPLQIWDKSSNSFLIQFTTDTSNVSQIRTFNHLSCKSWALM